MSYKAPTSNIDKLKQLFHQLVAETEIDTGDDPSNPIVLAKWQVSKPAGYLDNDKYIASGFMSGEMIRDAGTSAVAMQFQRSSDDISYNQIMSMTGTGAVYELENDNISNFMSSDDDIFFRLVLQNNDGATSGRARRLQSTVLMMLPQGMTIQKVL